VSESVQWGKNITIFGFKGFMSTNARKSLYSGELVFLEKELNASKKVLLLLIIGFKVIILKQNYSHYLKNVY